MGSHFWTALVYRFILSLNRIFSFPITEKRISGKSEIADRRFRSNWSIRYTSIIETDKSVHFCGYDFRLYLHVIPLETFCENALSMSETILNANTQGITGNDFRVYICMQIKHRFPNSSHEHDFRSKRVSCPSCVKLKLSSWETEHELHHSQNHSVLLSEIWDFLCSNNGCRRVSWTRKQAGNTEDGSNIFHRYINKLLSYNMASLLSFSISIMGLPRRKISIP